MNLMSPYKPDGELLSRSKSPMVVYGGSLCPV